MGSVLGLSIGLLKCVLKLPRFKGMLGEWKVKLGAKLSLPANSYYPIHNVTTLSLPDGVTTQIDHIFVSRFGIFAVEMKNMKGWIFGSQNQFQ